jgi:ribosome-associated protein
LTPELITKRIAELIFEKKGVDVKLIELHKVTTLTDYFIICSADSDTQVKAIADHVESELKDAGVKLWHKEGYRALSWVLLDYVDIVVHIFKTETRGFYNLEKLWGDAPIHELKDESITA